MCFEVESIGVLVYDTTHLFFVVLGVDQLPSHYSLPCGLVAGALASATTQPADVIKTRMQVQPESFANISHTLLATIKNGGLSSLFVGLVPRATRRTLMASFTWAFYEHVSIWGGVLSHLHVLAKLVLASSENPNYF